MASYIVTTSNLNFFWMLEDLFQDVVSLALRGNISSETGTYSNSIPCLLSGSGMSISLLVKALYISVSEIMDASLSRS